MRIFGQSLGKQKHNFLSAQEQMEQDQDKYAKNRYPASPPKKMKPQFQKKHSPVVTGAISTIIDNFVIQGKGTQGSHFSDLSFTSFPAANKRILQPLFGTYSMTNYANVDFPQCIYLICNQIQGFINENNMSTHIIAVLAPLGAAVPVYNSGGIIGYNMTYGMVQGEMQYDITNVNDLTFDISISPSGPSLAYPLSQNMTIGLRTASAAF